MKSLGIFLILWCGVVSIGVSQGRVGINTLTPAGMLHVKDSSVVFTAGEVLDPAGPPPVSGTGNRMMWYADKAAFRAGRASDMAWEKDSIGYYSAAFGWENVASGITSFVGGGLSNRASGLHAFVGGGNGCRASGYSACVVGGTNTKASGTNASVGGGSGNAASGNYSVVPGGSFNIASGTNSFAAGYLSKAIAPYSTAIGYEATTTGNYATAFGNETKAAGRFSATFGSNTQSNGAGSMVIGVFNDTIVAPQTQISTTTPLLIIGNGSLGERSNAMVVRKDGNVGIGTNAPSRLLHIQSGSSGASPGSSGSLAIIERNGAAYLNILTPDANESGVLFGNTLHHAHGGIVYNSTPDFGLSFRTNGNTSRMVIDASGNIGMGTTAHARRLEVSGEDFQAVRISSTNNASPAIELLRSTGIDWRMINNGGILYFGNSGNNLETVTEIVRIGGATFTPASDNTISCGSASLKWTAVYAVNGTIQTSDSRTKESITDLDAGLDRVMRLRPVTFTWKDSDIDNRKQHAGLLAQDLFQVLPEAVVTHAWKDNADQLGRTWSPVEYLGVNYAEIIPLLTKAIQEQQERIEHQEVVIGELIRRLELLEKAED